LIFAHDTEVSLNAAAALVNTGTEGELLADVEALDRFVTEWGWTGQHAGDTRELKAVRALRPRVRALWTADTDEAATLVNDMLREAKALPQLVKHDEWDYHLHATAPSAGLHVRMMVEAAMAVVDVIRMGELDRLRVCAADTCSDVLVDLSKNRSRRFCEQNCGNRANVAAYRARRAKVEGAGQSVS
jgi:predicted RNA-binding Zn ribbon-like protein